MTSGATVTQSTVTKKQTAVTVPFVDLKAQYEAIRSEVRAAIDRVLERGDFILGDAVRQFEAEFTAFCGVKFAIGVSSGTEAIRLALEACGAQEGEVITVANTYVGTVEAIVQAKATPVLVDVSPKNYNMDLDCLERAITPKTRAIIPVHLYGQPVDMDPLLEIARRHKLIVIEDACQAHGARYKGRRAGSLADMGCFSFYPSKNLGAYGDGGLITTDNPEYASKLNLLRNHGEKVKYEHVIQGSTSRLDTLQAAILRIKLARLDGWNALRRSHAQYYTQELKKLGIAGPIEEPWAESVYHLYVITVPDREALRRYLSQQGIQSGIHYPIPIHKQQAFSGIDSAGAGFSVAENLAEQIISLPMFAELEGSQIARVVESIGRFYGRI